MWYSIWSLFTEFISLFASSVTSLSSEIVSLLLCIISPGTGQREKKEKSYFVAGGERATKPTTSGRRIVNCIATHAPKEKPTIQIGTLLGLCSWSQSIATAASVNSPIPLSKVPVDFPTPRKLIFNAEKLLPIKDAYILCIILLFILPPYWGWWCKISTTGALASLLW
ncbi:DNA polymerase III beta subunit [Wolbachia endosymbiont of Cimex lectularius]|nr:DNA polymerase III beta subunit [Wolbachia endosymbiont of Cimex lectularius]